MAFFLQGIFLAQGSTDSSACGRNLYHWDYPKRKWKTVQIKETNTAESIIMNPEILNKGIPSPAPKKLTAERGRPKDEQRIHDKESAPGRCCLQMHNLNREEFLYQVTALASAASPLLSPKETSLIFSKIRVYDLIFTFFLLPTIRSILRVFFMKK